MNEANSDVRTGKRSGAHVIAYWIVTGVISFELIQGTLWAFNLINKGKVPGMLRHLGYPQYLAAMLGISYFAAAVVILVPGFRLLKEWAYAGLTILYIGAISSHLAVGDGPGKFIFPLIFGLLTIASWALRPASRRLLRR